MTEKLAREVLDYLTERNMAFCYGTQGQFYTVGECKKVLGLVLESERDL
jgi:hypothetical protein